MARKTNQPTNLDPVAKAEWNFHRLEREYDAAVKKWIALGDEEDPKLDKRVSYLQLELFRAFDMWHHLKNHKVTVPYDEIGPIVLNAIKESKEVFDYAFVDLIGRAKASAYAQLAFSVFDEIKGTGVEVRETEIERPPFCESCAEELDL